MSSFIFGGNTGETAESLKKKRAMAEAMMARGAGGPARNLGEGISSAASSISGALLKRSADKKIAEGQGEASELFKALTNGGINPEGGGPDMNAIYGAMSHPFATDAHRGIAQAMLGQANDDRRFQREDERYSQRQATEQEQWQQRFDAQNAARRSTFDYEQANAYRAPKPRQTVKAADGYNYFVDTGERVVPGVEAAQPERWENLSPGQEAMDKEFAKELAEFEAGGGFADAEKNVEQLRGVSNRLKAVNDPANPSGENLTGPLVGGQFDIVNTIINPSAIEAREDVEEVVQRNLRLVLGAQFTEKEGERLIARAYNPRLDEKTNAKRVDRLLGAMETGLQAKKASADYFRKHGTLNGYQGPTPPTKTDLESVIEGDQAGTVASTDDDLINKYLSQ